VVHTEVIFTDVCHSVDSRLQTAVDDGRVSANLGRGGTGVGEWAVEVHSRCVRLTAVDI